MSPLDALSKRARRTRARPDWRAGWRALQRLLDEPDETENAFHVFRALDPNADERRLCRMLREPEGRQLFLERPRLMERLSDRAYLQGLPERSLGRAYLAHIERHRLDPGKLVQLRRELGERDPMQDAGLEWYAERQLLMHDLWHVLAGYGADDLGEAALLPFSWAQQGGLANGFLTLGAAFRVWNFPDTSWPRYVWRAWRRGRRALPLDTLAYEELLAEPLEEVRRAVGIDPPEQSHPDGVLESERRASAA